MRHQPSKHCSSYIKIETASQKQPRLKKALSYSNNTHFYDMNVFLLNNIGGP